MIVLVIDALLLVVVVVLVVDAIKLVKLLEGFQEVRTRNRFDCEDC